MILNKEKALAELQISESMYKELVAETIGQVEDFTQKVDGFVASKDFEGLAKGAHFIKGSTGMMGMEDLHTLSRELEMGGKEKRDAGYLSEKASQLKKALQDLKEAAQKI